MRLADPAESLMPSTADRTMLSFAWQKESSRCHVGVRDEFGTRTHHP